MIVLALACAALAFLVSAWAGLGGSLVLVPALSLLLGAKQGVAVSAALLAGNNLAKVFAYRRTIPLKAAALVLVLTVVGSVVGARLLVDAPERWVGAAIVATFAATFAAEQAGLAWQSRYAAPALAVCAGATSGFSGTSGPLKGIALRSLKLDRLHFVGAASAVSLAGDVAKSAVFAGAGLLSRDAWLLVLAAAPLMPLAAFAGRRLNSKMGERVHAALFWVVMTGYSIRLLVA